MTHTHYYTVDAKTHFEEGYSLAQLFLTSSREIVEDTLKAMKPNPFLLEKSKLYLKETQKHFNPYIETLKGYAKGIGVDFSLFWLTFLTEELNSYPEKCSSCFSADGMIIGHNEDFYSYYSDRIAFVEKKVGSVSTLELCYHNSIGGTACGINSHGIVQTINTLHHTDTSIGVPRNIIARWLADTANPEIDFQKMKGITRSLGYSHTFAAPTGKICNIESTATQSVYSSVQPPYVHTNHYISSLSSYEDASSPGNSEDRYAEAKKGINSVKTAQDMMQLLERISCLQSNKERQCDTIARMVFDLKRKEVWGWLEREKSKGWICYPIQFL